jgi:hypothetical protein
MRASRFPVLVAVTLLFIAASAVLRAQDQKSASQEERTKAVNFVRLVNTAELRYKTGTNQGANDAHGRYASWEELYESGVLKAVQAQWALVKGIQFSRGPEAIPGHRLDLLVSSDGALYSLALHDTKEGDSLFSVFSDQSGLIFLGSPLQ